MDSIKTVGELMDKLSWYQRELPIVSTWEGIYVPIKGYMKVAEVCGIETLILDVDNY